MRMLFDLLLTCLLRLITFVEWAFPSSKKLFERFFSRLDDQVPTY